VIRWLAMATLVVGLAACDNSYGGHLAGVVRVTAASSVPSVSTDTDGSCPSWIFVGAVTTADTAAFSPPTNLGRWKATIPACTPPNTVFITAACGSRAAAVAGGDALNGGDIIYQGTISAPLCFSLNAEGLNVQVGLGQEGTP
jgi:hypothetical protein